MDSKKKYGLVVFALLSVAVFVVAACTSVPRNLQADTPDLDDCLAGQLKRDIDPEEDTYAAEGDKRHLLDNNPEPVFVGQDPVPDNLFDIDSQIDEVELASQDARVIAKEVMSYGDFLKKYDESKSTGIDENRLVWVVTVYYPNGFMTKRGLFKDATVRGLYDAETGFYFGFSLFGECDDIALPIGRGK